MSTEAEPKPLPHPTTESQPYWDGAAQGRLRLKRCTGCGAVRHYPQLVCARCYSLGVEWIDASGRGAVHSWTVAHRAFHPAFKADLPYTLVTVDLEEGPRARPIGGRAGGTLAHRPAGAGFIPAQRRGCCPTRVRGECGGIAAWNRRS